MSRYKIYLSVLVFLFAFNLGISAKEVRLNPDYPARNGASLNPAYTAYIERWKATALAQQAQYGIPASITLAQGLLESGAGQSDLASQANNHFGIKCHSDWEGKTFRKDDDKRDECFRSYAKAEDSFRDHSLFLKRKRYEVLFTYDVKDYKAWANGLKACGYATDPAYPQKLIRIIETYGLADLKTTGAERQETVDTDRRQTADTDRRQTANADRRETVDTDRKQTAHADRRETADTVSFNLPIYSGTNNDGSAAGGESIRFTTQTSFGNSKGLRSIRGRYNSNALGEDSICFGINSFVRGFASFGVGRDFDSYGDYATIFGYGTQTKNLFETAIGKHNTSNSGSTDASKTLFSVGNGTSTSARHNAFEIRMNGDIYITKDGSDIKLQDQLGGGGSSYTAGDGIDITNDVISVTGKADTSAVTESINAAVSGKADTSDVFITSSNRNSIVSNIHEEVYQLSTDDIYSITATKASSGDIIYCQIMIDNTLYDMQGSSSSITYSDEALSGLVTADFSTSMSITLNDRENHHINEVFIEAFNTNGNSYIKEITIVHNPPIGANKIDYVSSIYTEFVHDQYAMKTDLNRKQDTLVSGTNIKTINNESILGSGNITIQGGGSVDQTVISGSTNAVAGGAVYTQLDGLKLKKITQSAYDALSPNYDANTLYVING